MKQTHLHIILISFKFVGTAILKRSVTASIFVYFFVGASGTKAKGRDGEERCF